MENGRKNRTVGSLEPFPKLQAFILKKNVNRTYFKNSVTDLYKN